MLGEYMTLSQETKQSGVAETFAIGLMALSLFSFTGCSTKSYLEAESRNPPAAATWVDRGAGVFFIPTTEGTESSRALADLMKSNPESKIMHIERTGRYDVTNSNGAGFIIVLEAK